MKKYLKTNLFDFENRSTAARTPAPFSVFFFQNEIIYFSDTLILKIYFLIIKINIFRGDLSGISAKKSSLVPLCSTGLKGRFNSNELERNNNTGQDNAEIQPVAVQSSPFYIIILQY